MTKDQRPTKENVYDIALAADANIAVCITNAGGVRRIVLTINVKNAPGQR